MGNARSYLLVEKKFEFMRVPGLKKELIFRELLIRRWMSKICWVTSRENTEILLRGCVIISNFIHLEIIQNLKIH